MRKKKKGFFSKKNAMSLFIIAIMVLSVGGFAVLQSTTSERITYNDISFMQKGRGWTARIDKQQMDFDYLPSEVENIKVSKEIIDRIANTFEVDTTYNPNSTYLESISLAQLQLSQALALKNIYYRVGFTEENKFDFPIITCDDATESIPVIYFRGANQTAIYEEANCIIAEAKREADFLRIKDRLIFGVFGVIE